MTTHPSGKQLIADDRGRLWITSREVDRDGTVGYALLRVETEIVNGFRYRYEATAAADVYDEPCGQRAVLTCDQAPDTGGHQSGTCVEPKDHGPHHRDADGNQWTESVR